MQYCSVPTRVEDLVASHVFVKKICAGAFHNAALSLDGEVFTWGSNTGGCLGRMKELHDLEETFCAVPGRVEGLDNLVGPVSSSKTFHIDLLMIRAHFIMAVACGREFTLIATMPYTSSR